MLTFSPERENPNNAIFSTSTIPKIVGSVTENWLKVALAVYDKVIVEKVPVSSPRVAKQQNYLRIIIDLLT